jgi:predicted DNA-binding antitoxin AbrB/MazE fold protein
MAITVEAIYENGLLRPLQPLALKEHQQVRLTIEAEDDPVRRTYGLIRWTGDLETLDRFVMDPELDPQEGP